MAKPFRKINGIVILAFAAFSFINSECPNACSAHGKCGPSDACTCYRNWMGGDCSERICQFGFAYVDTPLGDLDSSNTVTGPKTTVIVNSQLYPSGTSEQFPNIIDSNHTVLTNSGHTYVECSNNGFCDRRFGTCVCFEGYQGSACQYNVCPSVASVICNGHGICESAKSLAALDNGNIYELWDARNSMGCKCDAGFYGPACNFRRCKIGFDPMFYDVGSVLTSQNSFRFANWSFVVAAQTNVLNITGNFSIVFYDVYGEDWQTDPISVGASCTDIVLKLEKLPNNVIPYNSVRCLRWPSYQSISAADEPALLTPNPYNGMKYTLAFPINPGKLAQFTTNIFLDGYRPTLNTGEQKVSTLQLFTYPNGFFGSNVEYFPDKCEEVDVTLAVGGSGSYNYLSGLTSIEVRLLSQCLGDADGLSSYSAAGRVLGVAYTWDYGTIYTPHLIRLVDQTQPATTDLCNGREVDSVRGSGVLCSYPYRPPGFITALYYNPTTTQFVILTRPAGDYSSTTLFAVFTTTGTTQMVSEQVRLYTDWTPYSRTVYTTNSTDTFNYYHGNVDCETNTANINGAFACVEKGANLFFLDPYISTSVAPTTTPAASPTSTTPSATTGLATITQTTTTASAVVLSNPKYMNLYAVQKISKVPGLHDNDYGRFQILLDMSINTAWTLASPRKPRLYLFYPNTTYNVASECSNRGDCDVSTGLCSCYAGFTNDDCSVKDGLTG